MRSFFLYSTFNRLCCIYWGLQVIQKLIGPILFGQKAKDFLISGLPLGFIKCLEKKYSMPWNSLKFGLQLFFLSFFFFNHCKSRETRPSVWLCSVNLHLKARDWPMYIPLGNQGHSRDLRKGVAPPISRFFRIQLYSREKKISVKCNEL